MISKKTILYFALFSLFSLTITEEVKINSQPEKSAKSAEVLNAGLLKVEDIRTPTDLILIESFKDSEACKKHTILEEKTPPAKQGTPPNNHLQELQIYAEKGASFPHCTLSCYRNPTPGY